MRLCVCMCGACACACCEGEEWGTQLRVACPTLSVTPCPLHSINEPPPAVGPVYHYNAVSSDTCLLRPTLNTHTPTHPPSQPIHPNPTPIPLPAVGPVYDNDAASEPLLASAYRSSLQLANERGLKTVAFPAISCGVFGAFIMCVSCVGGWWRVGFPWRVCAFCGAKDSGLPSHLLWPVWCVS